MKEVLCALEKSGRQPETTYRALEALVHGVIGVKLFTLMEVDLSRGVAWRSYSNMPEAYPVFGEKPWVQNAWSKIVVERREIFVANSIQDIAEVFPDYELIQSLGCQSCLNIPVFICGEIRGTLNCLHEANHFTSERIAAAHDLKAAGALAFLLAQNLRYQGEHNG